MLLNHQFGLNSLMLFMKTQDGTRLITPIPNQSTLPRISDVVSSTLTVSSTNKFNSQINFAQRLKLIIMSKDAIMT